VYCLYRTHEGPGSNTRARLREVTELARTDLQDDLEALEMLPQMLHASR